MFEAAVTDRLTSKTDNEDLKNVINTTRDVASNLKNEAIDEVNGRGSVFGGGSAVSSVVCHPVNCSSFSVRKYVLLCSDHLTDYLTILASIINKHFSIPLIYR